MLYFPVYALFHYYPEQAWWHVALTVILLAGGVALLVLFYKKGRIDKRSMGWGIALWMYTVFLLFITVIGRYSFEDYRVRMAPFESYREYFETGSFSELRGIIGNALMFIPFSFLCAQYVSCLSGRKRNELSDSSNGGQSEVRASKKRPIVIALVAGLLMTVLIETLQLITRTGTFEMDDLMHNAIGTLIGVGIWLGISRLRFIAKKNKQR